MNTSNYIGKKVLTGNSFTLLAPTKKGRLLLEFQWLPFLQKNLYFFPTTFLVEQTAEKLREFGISSEILAFTPSKSKNKKMQRLVKIDFLILLTTSMFLCKNYNLIRGPFRFIFIDYIDSFLKTSKEYR